MQNAVRKTQIFFLEGKKMKRREFLRKSAAGAAGLLVGSKAVWSQCCAAKAAAAEPAAGAKTFDPYEMVSLGKTGIKVSRVGFGTGMGGGNHSSNQTRLGKEKFQHLLRESYDHGCRFFDCADMYGSHPYIIPALKGIPRDNFVISSKIMIWNPPEAEREKPQVTVERFLKELNTDYIDLLLLHCMIPADWNKKLRPYMDGMYELKQKQKVRAVGVSVHTIGALKTAAAEPWVDSVHARINAYGSKMDGPPEEVVPIVKKIHDAGKGVVGMKLIGEGAFRYSRQLREHSADFVLNLGCVDTVVVGFESLEEINDYEDIVRKTPVAAG